MDGTISAFRADIRKKLPVWRDLGFAGLPIAGEALRGNIGTAARSFEGWRSFKKLINTVAETGQHNGGDGTNHGGSEFMLLDLFRNEIAAGIDLSFAFEGSFPGRRSSFG